MEKLDKVRSVGVGSIDLPPEIGVRLQQMVREGLRFTAQAFQQMSTSSRTADGMRPLNRDQEPSAA